MRRKIFFITTSILFILITCITYLSIFGIKTDKFNNFINNKFKKYNSKLILKVDEVFIKLNLSELAININTNKNPEEKLTDDRYFTVIAITIPKIPKKLPCLDVSDEDKPLKARMNNIPDTK